MPRVCLRTLLLTRCHGNEASTSNCEKVVFYFPQNFCNILHSKKVRNEPLLVCILKVHGSRPCVRYHTVPVYSSPPYIPRDELNEGRMFRTLCNSFQIQESRMRCSQLSGFKPTISHNSHDTRCTFPALEVSTRNEALKTCMQVARQVQVSGTTLWFKKNAPTMADYNYDPVQSILIIFGKLFVNDHKCGLVVKFSTSPHICCHYTL